MKAKTVMFGAIIIVSIFFLTSTASALQPNTYYQIGIYQEEDPWKADNEHGMCYADQKFVFICFTDENGKITKTWLRKEGEADYGIYELKFCIPLSLKKHLHFMLIIEN